jgi:hypothetical protein
MGSNRLNYKAIRAELNRLLAAQFGPDHRFPCRIVPLHDRSSQAMAEKSAAVFDRSISGALSTR